MVHENIPAMEAAASPAGFRDAAESERPFFRDKRPKEQRPIAADKASTDRIRNEMMKTEAGRKQAENARSEHRKKGQS
jgi:phage-related protein